MDLNVKCGDGHEKYKDRIEEELDLLTDRYNVEIEGEATAKFFSTSLGPLPFPSESMTLIEVPEDSEIYINKKEESSEGSFLSNLINFPEIRFRDSEEELISFGNHYFCIGKDIMSDDEYESIV